MKTPDTDSPQASLLKIRLRIKTWENRSSHHGEPLIHPRYLAEIEALFATIRRELQIFTLPDFPEDCRFLPPENLSFLADFIGLFWDEHARAARRIDLKVNTALWSLALGSDDNPLTELLCKTLTPLEARWDEVLLEARERLGAKFDAADYPAPDHLAEHFSIECEIESGSVQ